MFSRKKVDKSSESKKSAAKSEKNTVSVREFGSGSKITETRTVTHSQSFESNSTRITSREITTAQSIFSTKPGNTIWNTPKSVPIAKDATPFGLTYGGQKPRMIGYIEPLTSRSSISTSNITAPSSLFPRQLRTSQSLTQPSSSNVNNQNGQIAKQNNTSPPVVVRDPFIPTYTHKGKNRAKVLIINNVKFLDGKNNQERKGAIKDEEDLTTLFQKEFGFDVKAKRNKTSVEMKSILKEFAKDSKLKTYDIAIVVLMSHGNSTDGAGNQIPGGYTQIYGTDNIGVSTEFLVHEFSNETCKHMAGKPKIFIIQCCRGDADERILRDAAPLTPQIRSHSDILLAYSTIPGFASNRNPEQGTWYIQSICNVFGKHAHRYDVESMLQMVDEELSTKHPQFGQTTNRDSRGFKTCYLDPKPRTK